MLRAVLPERAMLLEALRFLQDLLGSGRCALELLLQRLRLR
jgi:hypothetical protein